MSETVVLRKVYAIDSNTGLFMSSANVLCTTPLGGTAWINVLSSLNYAGGSVIGNLASTIYNLNTTSTINTGNILSLQIAISSITPGNVTPTDLLSTTAGLGSASYVSTSGLLSSIESLGLQGYVSSQSVTSSFLGYITDGTLPSTLSLRSSLEALGTQGYVSTLHLRSTVFGLGTAEYISSAGLVSTVAGLGTSRYVSSAGLVSTVIGLGQANYVSSSALVSTVAGISSTMLNLRFDRTTNVYVQNSIVNFTSTGMVSFLSSFYLSSIAPTGTYGTQYNAQILNTTDLAFSSLNFSLAPLSSFITPSSLVILDVQPHIAFNRLADSATAVTVLQLSTFVQMGTTVLSSPMTTSWLFAGNTVTNINGINQNSSNFFNSPIKLQFPRSTIHHVLQSSLTLMHYLPLGLAAGGNTNGLSNQSVTPYFGAGSLFVSVQNS